ncbi:MAG: tyrosine-type recombinase/integrase [Synechococcaceae cyanobacterium SM2_3_2]|nr:tyrosine-type recombinase/integrase [Synechococcaceae cyanobacterium SM2_3_2]
MGKPDRESKSPKGTVTVEVFQKRLRLRWRQNGKRYNLSIGLPDSKVNRRVAQQRATQIELDIASGHFDQSLRKYKPSPEVSSSRFEGSLLSLLEDRIEDNFNHADSAVLKLLNHWNHPIKSPSDAEAFIGWIKSERKVKNSTIHRYLDVLKKVDRENFGHIVVKVEKKGIPRAYTSEQVKAILAFLDTDFFYKHYKDFVEFLLLTGCRTSEAICLRWKNVDFYKRDVCFEESLAEQKDGSLLLKSTKTGVVRRFPMNSRLYSLLKIRYEELDDPSLLESLVFPAKGGGYINRRDFRRRCWQKCLEAGGIKFIPRTTTPYKTRHTVISHAIEQGVNPVLIADMVGHDVKTLYEKYASVINREELPTFF